MPGPSLEEKEILGYTEKWSSLSLLPATPHPRPLPRGEENSLLHDLTLMRIAHPRFNVDSASTRGGGFSVEASAGSLTQLLFRRLPIIPIHCVYSTNRELPPETWADRAIAPRLRHEWRWQWQQEEGQCLPRRRLSLHKDARDWELLR